MIKKIFLPTALTTAALLLVGCAVTDPADNPEPTEDIVLAPITELVAGDVIENPDLYEKTAENKKVFKLDDGTAVIVEKDKPLPQPVQEALETDLDEILADTGYYATGYTLIHAMNDYEYRTGKKVVVVEKLWGAREEDPDARWLYQCQVPYAEYFLSVEGAIAACEAYVAEQEDPENYAIIVAY